MAQGYRYNGNCTDHLLLQPPFEKYTGARRLYLYLQPSGTGNITNKTFTHILCKSCDMPKIKKNSLK